MKMRVFVSAIAGLAIAISGLVAAEKEFKATCPVSGQPAKEANSVDYMGKKVYFCCMNCPKKFKADPAAFAAKANAQLAETGQITQVACPISGKACNPAAKSEVAGATVCFCCKNCKSKVDSASDAVAMVFGDGAFEKAFTLQTTCPVSGKPIKADKVVEHNGKKVYFCCGNCPKAFESNPEKYTEKLPQFNQSNK
jgi:YHS domain-containing protein